MLDTNVVSDLVRRPDGTAARHLLSEGTDSAGISIVVACEIQFGLAKIGKTKLASRMRQLLHRLEIAPLTKPVDVHYGDIRKELEGAGTPIGPNDMLIAAHARALELTLVTGNVREFDRVPKLRVENWLTD